MTARILLLIVALWGLPAGADRITVAVAANFLTTARDISAAYSAETGHEVALVHGSTGKLFAQIVAGAPFDLFLSADAARPARLAESGRLADGLPPRTYAIGRLSLVHGDKTEPGTLEEILSRPDLRIAVADPAVAPYGGAARDVLRTFRQDGWDRGLLRGESVGQAFAFVATGNADAGLVALAQALTFDREIWAVEVPETLHEPILQDAVLLKRAGDNDAALAFLDFLGRPIATEIMAAAGYRIPP